MLTWLMLAALLAQAALVLYLARRALRSDDRRPWVIIAAGATLTLGGCALGIASWWAPGLVLFGIGAAVLLSGIADLSSSIQGLRKAKAELEVTCDRMEALGRLGRHALAVTEWDLVRDLTCNLLSRTLAVDFAIVMNIDPEIGELAAYFGDGRQVSFRPVAHFSLEDEFLEPLLSSQKPMELPLPEEEESELGAFLRERQVVCSAGTVFSGSRGMLGILSVHTRQNKQFTQPDLIFLARVGSILAHAFENREHREAYDDLLLLREGATELALSFDSSEQVSFINREGLQLLGFGLGPLAPLHLEDLFAPWACRRIRKEAIPKAEDCGLWFGKTAVMTQEGSEIPFFLVMMAHRDENEDTRFYSMYGFDLNRFPEPGQTDPTAVERGVERVRQLEDRLQEAYAEVEMFAESIGRGLQEPIGAIASFTRGMLEKGGSNLDSSSRRSLELISQAARSAGEIVARLHRAARVGRAELNLQQLDVRPLVQAAFNEASRNSDRQIRLTIRSLFAAPADRSLLGKVFIQLLGNSVRAIQKVEDPWIDVGSRVDPGRIVFFVRDNGPRISSEDMEQLFHFVPKPQEGFERTGLFEVRRILRRHGGDAWGECSQGDEVTFFFSLPVQLRRTED